jgi:D-arabinose 1-dehydrogenase-like Zn-dependent alcohol dehydrogenase
MGEVAINPRPDLEENMTMKVLGYAAQSAKADLVPYRFDQRDPRLDDVVIEILYCGVCIDLASLQA